jgi:hypothetical protein
MSVKHAGYNHLAFDDAATYSVATTDPVGSVADLPARDLEDWKLTSPLLVERETLARKASTQAVGTRQWD